MDNIALLSFNNYFNRKYKKYANLSEYEPYILETKNGVNFNPNDGVTTSLVVNTTTEPNYLIVTKGASNVIDSRWFVIEQRRNRQGQYTLTLRRDVVVDCIQDPSKVTVFADRGYVPNTSAFIFNSEGNSYNQIKKKESILKDGSASPWLVGYLASNVFEQGDITINVSPSIEIAYDYTYANTDAMLQAHPYTSLVQGHNVPNEPNVTTAGFDMRYSTVDKISYTGHYDYMYVDYVISEDSSSNFPMQLNIGEQDACKESLQLNMTNDTTYSALNYAITEVENMPDSVEMSDIINNANKVARVGNVSSGYTYYKLIVSSGSISDIISKTYSKFTAPGQVLNVSTKALLDANLATGSNPDVYFINYIHQNTTVYWKQISTLNSKITLNADAPIVDKSPYYCFAIPYNGIAIKKGALITSNSASSSRKLARQIATQLSSFCYDVQLLPYFPLQSYINNEGMIDITEMSTKQYAYLAQGEAGGITSILFWINEPNFSFKIEDSIVYNSQEPKIQNETQFCRLNSPNYAASFDFSVAKNKGVGYWQVDCSYKPYQPYIHVAPNWKGLYGSNFNDARGLICTGDFSIDLMTDKWQEYQIQNKNYNEIFNRQIQTLDLQQSIASTNEKWQVALGAVSSALQGAASGSALGPYGAIGGAAIGGISSAIAGAVDMNLNQQLRDDARSSAYDMLNFQLGNIKALPNTLTKVSTYNINNKIYPFYEIYEATSEEIENLRLQLKLRGYNLGISGILSTFMVEGKYFKGKIIYNEDVVGDSHMAEVLNSELTTGIYF